MAPNMNFATTCHEPDEQQQQIEALQPSTNSLAQLLVIMQDIKQTITKLRTQQNAMQPQIQRLILSEQTEARNEANDVKEDKSSQTEVNVALQIGNDERSITKSVEMLAKGSQTTADNQFQQQTDSDNKNWKGYLDFVIKNDLNEYQTMAILPVKLQAPYICDTQKLKEIRAWPIKHTVELMSNECYKEIVHKIGMSHKVCFKPMIPNWREPQLPQKFSSFIGCINLTSTPNSKIRIMILYYASLTKTFLALIPNNQQALIDAFAKVNREGTMDDSVLLYKELENFKQTETSCIANAQRSEDFSHNDTAALLLERKIFEKEYKIAMEEWYEMLGERNQYQISFIKMSRQYEDALSKIQKMKQNIEEERRKASKDMSKLSDKYDASINERDTLKKEVLYLNQKLVQASTQIILLEEENVRLTIQKDNLVKTPEKTLENAAKDISLEDELESEEDFDNTEDYASTKKLLSYIKMIESDIKKEKKTYVFPHFTDSSLRDRLDALKQQREVDKVLDKLKEKERKKKLYKAGDFAHWRQLRRLTTVPVSHPRVQSRFQTEEKAQTEAAISSEESQDRQQIVDDFNRRVDVFLENSDQTDSTNQTKSSLQVKTSTEDLEPETNNFLKFEEKMLSNFNSQIKRKLKIDFDLSKPFRCWRDNKSGFNIDHVPPFPAHCWSSTDPLLP